MTYVERMHKAVSKEIVAADSSCPDGLVELYTLLALTTGVATSLEDVHDAWSVWRVRTNPEHCSIVPFSDLTREIQEYDRKYCNAIIRAVIFVSRDS